MSDSKLVFEKVVTTHEINRKTKPDFIQEFIEYLFYFVKVFVFVALIHIFITRTLISPFTIVGTSMASSYKQDDSVYIDQFSPNFGDYERGDVVVLYSPPDKNGRRKMLIKRIVGLPSEKIILDKGKVFIVNSRYPDGVELIEDYLDPGMPTYKNIQLEKSRFEEKVLREKEYYVLGDNRTVSNDSRSFGIVKKKDIVGREIYRLKPPEKKGFFKLPKYNIDN